VCVCGGGVGVGRSGLKAARSSSFRITSGYKEECCYTSMDTHIPFPHCTQASVFSFLLPSFFAHGAKFEPQGTLLLVSFGG